MVDARTSADRRKTALKWLRQAEHDLRLADQVRAIRGYDLSCFLAHQAVEKLLKAALALERDLPPKTHDLPALGRNLALDAELVDDLQELAGDYAASRYPDMGIDPPCVLFDDALAQERVEVANRIFRKLRSRFDAVGDA